ncbi:helix-turn-helix domain-containing protein, partial [Thermobifida cellulosilytica]
MNDAARESIGVRIARARKRRGLTQHGLAARCHYSRSHIAQVEKGHKVATPAFVAAAAAALAVDPSELYGQPYRGDTPRDDQVHAAIPELRRALTAVDAPPDLDAPPRDLDQLAAEVAVLRRDSLAARHSRVGARLPAVLVELAVHAHASGSPRAWRLLNSAQAVAASLARRLGYTDLASVAIKDAAVAADRSDDPNLPRLALLSRALLMMTIGAWEPGLALVRRAGEGLDTTAPAGLAVYGALHLRSAVLSARSTAAGHPGPQDAWDHYEQAREIAARLPARAPDFYALQFNPTNVAIHGAAVAVELRDYDEAVRRDAELAPRLRRPGLPAERRAHHEIDMSRA